ncbi:MAG: SRPBCC family protein [Inquilinaceae bacterium]
MIMHGLAQRPDTDIVIKRVLKAPRRRVWRAWTDPVQIAAWWGPRGFTTRVERHEFHVGGHWRYVMIGPDGTEYPTLGVFQEIEPEERIVSSDEFDKGFVAPDGGALPSGTGATFLFEDLGDQTGLVIWLRHPTEAMRRRHEQMGVIPGWNSSIDDLDDHLAKDVAPASDHELVMTRTVDALRDRVWAAWTTPDQLARWFFPDGCRIENPSFDVRPGGAYACDFHGEDDAVYRLRGRFEDISRPDRLVFTHGWADADGVVEHDARVTVTFRDLGGRTQMTVRHVGLDSEEARASHSEGWSGALGHLAQLVAASD